MRSKQPSVAVYANQAAAAAALAGMTAGSLILTTDAPGSAFIVGLNAGAKVLLPINSATALGEWASRVLKLTATPGGAGSGLVTYAAEVVNGAGDPVPSAMVVVGAQRTVGAGAATLSVTSGQIVAYVNQGGGTIIAVIMADGGTGKAGFTLTGTAGDTWTVNAATDAATGGTGDQDAGRVLP